MSNTFTVTPAGYIQLPIIVDPNTIIQQAIAAIQADLPGWIPKEGHIEMLLLEQFGAMTAQAANVAASASIAIFEYFGQLLGVLPINGAPATALTTWTMVDTNGYTVPAGTVVGYQVSNGQQSLFSTTTSFSTVASSPGRVIAAAQLNTGSPNIIDPANSFTEADVNKSVNDGGVAIPQASCAVGNTTIASGSNGVSLPQSTIDVASVTGFATAGSLLVQTTSGYTTVAYTGVSGGNSFTGCSGGTGSLATGGTVIADLVLPTGTITVNSTTGFGSTGSVIVYTNTGTAATPVFTPQFVTYTGISGTTFTGCTGGVGNLWNANHVDPYILSIQTVGEATLSVNAIANESGEAVTLGSITGTQVVTNVPIQSQNVGSLLNNLPTGPLTLVFPNLSFVYGVSASTVSSGGTDPETTQQYIDRLSTELQLLTPRPILPKDYAILAQSVAGVNRATAYNNTYAGAAFPVNLVSGSPTVTAAPATTIASGSNGANLPQATINVATTTNFSPVGSLLVQTSAGFEEVNYTGITATTFTGCSGGAGTMSTGGVVSGSAFLFGSFEVGLPVTGTGIPSSTTLETYLNPVQFNMSNNANNNETYVTATLAPETNIEAAIAVSAIDSNGAAVSNSIATQIVALLSSLREVNFMVSYLQPSYQDLWVNYIVIATPGANLSTVTANVNAAVVAYLFPGNWAGGDNTPPTWDTTINAVYYLSLASVIEGVFGVQSIQVVGGTPSLGIGTSPKPAYGYNDISLAGAISTNLPNLISVSGTVLQGT